VLTSPALGATPDPRELLSVTALSAALPGRVVVEVTGEVDTYTAPLLDVCLQSQVARDAVREIVVDLRRVTLLGAAGITALARAERRCRARSARFSIATGGRPEVLRVLRLCGLADALTVDPVPEAPPRTSSRRRVRPVCR
jgi:anti-sigma B factor antagonist